MSAWDAGLNARTAIVTPPTDLPVTVEYIRGKVVKAASEIEDDAIERWIKTAVDACERETGRALMPQRRAWIADRFPCGKIVLPAPPLIDVVSVAYVDSNGDEQELAVSPLEFQIVPSGRVTKAELHPLYGQVWPTTRCQPGAVTVTYDCGYALDDSVSPPEVTVPEGLITGIGLMVGELYKLRSLSVHAVHNTPSVLDTKRFWQTVF